MFFLFNDVLLWTSKNGKLQNAVQLKNSEILPSRAKTNAIRKFELNYQTAKYKTFRLECDNKNVRNGWYTAISRTIFAAKNTDGKAWSGNSLCLNEKYKGYSDNLSDEEPNTTLESSDVNRDDDEDNKLEQSEQLDDPYNKRYLGTYNFKTQVFNQIDPMDDNLSQISDSDWSPRPKNLKLVEGRTVPTAVQLSPFKVPNKYITYPEKRVNNGSSTSSKNSNSISGGFSDESSLSVFRLELEDQRFEVFDSHGKTPCIIRSSNDDRGHNISSEYTIRLNDI